MITFTMSESLNDAVQALASARANNPQNEFAWRVYVAVQVHLNKCARRKL